MPAARSDYPGVARLSGVAGRPASPPASAISARCFATAKARRPNFCRPASKASAAQDKAAADAEMLALGLEATTQYGVTAPEIRMGDVALFCGLHRRARSRAGLATAADQGFQSQDPRWRTISISSRSPPPNGSQGISGRARGARRLRSQGRASPGHGSAVDRRHRHCRRPLRRRNRRPLPRTVGARTRRRGCRARPAR